MQVQVYSKVNFAKQWIIAPWVLKRKLVKQEVVLLPQEDMKESKKKKKKIDPLCFMHYNWTSMKLNLKQNY